MAAHGEAVRFRYPPAVLHDLVVRLAALSTALLAVCGGVSAGHAGAATHRHAAAVVAAPAAPGLHVSGAGLVDGGGRPVRLLGVDRSGTEYACIQGWGIFDGPSDAASVRAIQSWHTNAVRVPLNEDCWLDVNTPKGDPYVGAAYRDAITAYVDLLNSEGLYAILDLHLSAPGAHQATGQAIMPDADHAPAFWSSVAAAFRSNSEVLFDLFNEPYPEEDHGLDDPWACWLNGCAITDPFHSWGTWQAAGMQSLVGAVRGAGATNVIMAGGLSWANDLSSWRAHEPSDPAGELAASWHSYPQNSCDTEACWDAVIAPLAQSVPVITGETGDQVCGAATYDPVLLPWLDSHHLSYLGWTWDTWSQCSFVLIADYDGTPTANFGQYFHDHLLLLAQGRTAASQTSPASSPSPSPVPAGQSSPAAPTPRPPP